jgi:hypothetical protein
MTKELDEMTLRSRRSLRRNRGVDRTYAIHRERMERGGLAEAGQQERAVIRAPTALEVVQREPSQYRSS